MNFNSKYKFDMRGWWSDSYRHMLASKGVKTKYFAKKARLAPNYKEALNRVKPAAFEYGHQRYLEDMKREMEERKEFLDTSKHGDTPEVKQWLRKSSNPTTDGKKRGYLADKDLPRKQSLSRLVYGKDYFDLDKREKEDIDIQLANWRLNFAKKPLMKELKEADLKKGDEFEYTIVDSLTGEVKTYKGKKNFARKPHEFIKGGLSSGMLPKEFNQIQLKKGIKIEMEHTGDKRIAREIAMDHLVEDPKYYDHLIAMEKSVEKKKSRKYMVYTPAYVAGDLPVIATDAVGTAGAAVVPLIPIGVAAGAVYIGAKAIKKQIKGKRKVKK